MAWPRTVTTPFTPTDKQLLFLLSNHIPEILYGGAAGGGKSDGLLAAAAQYLDVPGYAAVLFRRTFPQLSMQGGLIERGHEWFQGVGSWNEQKKRWTFPSGATISFGHLQYSTTVYDWQGAELQFVGFDEATHFTEPMYRYLHSRLRKPSAGPLSDVPLRFRLASNPGGIGHEWVKDLFVDHPNDAQRCFIPATLADNPHLDESYEDRLDVLDPVERARLKHGDWDVSAGGDVFHREWFEIVPGVPEPDVVRRVRGWDMAATAGGGDATASMRWAQTSSGVFYVEDLLADHLDPGGRDALMLQTAHADGPNVEVAWEEEGGSSGKDSSFHFTRMLAGYMTSPVRVTGPKVVRAGAWASQARLGMVKLVKGPWNRHFLNAVQRFPEAFKDEIDAGSVAFHQLASSPVPGVEVW